MYCQVNNIFAQIFNLANFLLNWDLPVHISYCLCHPWLLSDFYMRSTQYVTEVVADVKLQY